MFKENPASVARVFDEKLSETFLKLEVLKPN